MSLTTKLAFNGEVGIIFHYLNCLRVLASRVSLEGVEEPMIAVSYLEPDEDLTVALLVPTPDGVTPERSVLVQLGQEGESGECRIAVSTDYGTEQCRDTYFDVEAWRSDLMEEIGLQLALFTVDYLKLGDQSLLAQLAGQVRDNVCELAQAGNHSGS